MSVLILGYCARPGCKGAILADGVCTLCARSVGEPVAEPKPFKGSVLKASFPDWSAKCNLGAHTECGGRRLARDASYGEKFQSCACPCHWEPAETKPRLPRANIRTEAGLGRGAWVALQATGSKRSAHLMLDASLVGNPPMYNSMVCGLWFPALDLRTATESLPRCKRCLEKSRGKEMP